LEAAFQIEKDQFEQELFELLPESLDACGTKEDNGIVFEWDGVGKEDRFVSVEYEGEATG
jgi:hypothetical protein